MSAQFDDMLQETHGYMRGEAIKLVFLPIMGQYRVTEALRLFETAQKKCGYKNRTGRA
jgi:hypothetical protein